MNPRIREALRISLSHLDSRVRSKLTAVFLAGSAADESTEQFADVDLFFLVDADYHQRQYIRLDSARAIDIFVYPLNYTVAQLTPRGNSLIVRALAGSKAVWDPRSILPELSRKADDLLSNLCEITSEQRYLLQLRTRRLYLALSDRANSPEQTNYLFALLAHSVAAAHVVADSQWSVGEKHAISAIMRTRPDVVRSIDRLLDTSRTPEERLHEARQAIDALLGQETLSATRLAGPLVGRDVKEPERATPLGR